MKTFAIKRGLLVALGIAFFVSFAVQNVIGETYQIHQDGNTWDVTPIYRAQNAGLFYDYHTASGHTPFMDAEASKIYFYVNSNTYELSIIIHHGEHNSGNSDHVEFDFLSVPGGAYVEVTDDDEYHTPPNEFNLSAEPEGNWSYNNRSDGGVLSGLPTGVAWSIEITPDFTIAPNITRWVYQEESNEITLDVTKNLTLSHDPNGNEPPTAIIDDISPNPAEEGEAVTFTGHGEDPDGSVVGWLWLSWPDDTLGTEASFTTSSLDVGRYIVRFKVQDDDGEWSEPDPYGALYVYDPSDFDISWAAPSNMWMGRFNELELRAEYVGGEVGGFLVYGLNDQCLSSVGNYHSDVSYPNWWENQSPSDWPWGTICDSFMILSAPDSFGFGVYAHWDWIGDPWSIDRVLTMVLNFLPGVGQYAEAFKVYETAVKVLKIVPQAYGPVITAVDGLKTVVNMDTYADVEYEGIGHAYNGTPFTIRWQVHPDKHGLWVASIIMQWPAALCTLIPSPWTWAMEVGLIIAGQLTYIAAYDPDSSYMELVSPEFIYPPELDSIDYLEARQMAYELFTAVGYLEALKVSFAKYQGALYDNNAEWAAAQLSVVQMYSQLAAQCLEPLPDFMDSNLVVPTQEQIDSMKSSFATNGLPPLEQSVLLQFGYTQDELDQLADGFADFPDEYYFATDSIPGFLKEAIYSLDSLPDYFGELPGGAKLADLGIDPTTLNLANPTTILSCWVELPGDSDLTGYEIITAVLNDSVPASFIAGTPGDYDSDGIQDIAMDFDISSLSLSVGEHLLSVRGDITLPTEDTVLYAGSAIITVIAYICGDVDGSGAVNVADLTYLVDYLFFGGPPPPVLEAANVDGEGGVNVADLTYLVEYLFFEGPEPICGPIE